jgi:hypothetical protein
MTHSKLQTEDPHIWGATVKNLVTRATWRPKFLHPSFWKHRSSKNLNGTICIYTISTGQESSRILWNHEVHYRVRISSKIKNPALWLLATTSPSNSETLRNISQYAAFLQRRMFRPSSQPQSNLKDHPLLTACFFKIIAFTLHISRPYHPYINTPPPPPTKISVDLWTVLPTSALPFQIISLIALSRKLDEATQITR